MNDLKSTRDGAERPSRLSFEHLEGRETPAGNVTASVVGNELYVFGDGNPAGNQVQISQDQAGNVLVTGLSGTTVNGQSRVLAGTGVPSRVNVQFNGAGSDYAELVTLMAGIISVSTGDGNDGIALSSVSANAVFVDAGAGDDGVLTHNVSTWYGTNVLGGAGNDGLLLGPVYGPTNYQQFENVSPTM